MSFGENDWIREISTGRIGIVSKKHWCEVAVRFGKAIAIRYPDEIELARLEIRNEDLVAIQHLAVETGDKEWFQELAERMGVKQIG